MEYSETEILIAENHMKLIFGTLLRSAIVVLLGLTCTVDQADTTYVNKSFIDSAGLPVIDAQNFVNFGTFGTGSASSSNFFGESFLLYRTLNTVNYTNRGVMEFFPGFDFRTFHASGDPVRGKSFYNGQGASIFSDVITEAGILNYFNADLQRSEAYGDIIIDSENVRNAGLLFGGAGGEIRISGKSVDLSSGIIEQPLKLYGYRSRDSNGTSYQPELGVIDLGWGYGSSLIGPRITALPPVEVAGNTVTNAIVSIGSDNFNMVSGAQMLQPLPTPYRIQMNNAQVFVHYQDDGQIQTNAVLDIIVFQSADTNVTARAAFSRTEGQPPFPTSLFFASFLNITASATNPVTGQLETVESYVVDRSAAKPTGTLLVSDATGTDYEPRDLYLTGPPNLGEPDLSVNFPQPQRGYTGDIFNLLPANTFTDRAGNDYAIDGLPLASAQPYAVCAGYLRYLQGDVAVPANALTLTAAKTRNAPLAFIDANGTPGVGFPQAGASYTNYGGRIAIGADSLDLSRTRIRAQGPLVIDAKEYSPRSASAVVDASLYSLNLANSTSPLLVTNLVHPTVSRLGGTYFLHSTWWTTTATRTFGTTTVSVNLGIHITVVDTTFRMLRPSLATAINLKSTNVVVGDSIVVADSFSTTAENFTLSPGATLSYLTGVRLVDFNAQQFPNLKNLTNFGIISTEGVIQLGEPPGNSILTLANSGTISSGSLGIRSGSILNSGQIGSQTGLMELVADNDFRITSGAITATNDVQITANNFAMSGGSITGGTITLTANKTLIGTGGALSSEFGIALPNLPATADLSGTSLQLNPGDFETAELDWSGRDLGPAPAGFVNNAAVKSLFLIGGASSGITLTGTGSGSNAIYAGKLVVTQAALDSLGGPLPLITVPDGFRVYFGDAVTDTGASAVDALLTSPTLAGKVVQVPGFSPSAPLVTLLDAAGKSYTVPWALRYSPTIDSDGDGIPNLLDASPFDPVRVSSMQIVGNPEKFLIQFTAAAGKTYQVEYATNVGKLDWRPLTTVTNTDTKPVVLEVKDPIRADVPSRVYRVSYTP